MFVSENLVSLPTRLETSAFSTVLQGVVATQQANGVIANNNLEVSQWAWSSASDFHPTAVDISIDN